MCRPEHFTVSYRINPWMHPEEPTDTSLAVQQWQTLYETYLELGFDVHLIDPIAGLPDMVYAANGGFVLDGIAYGAKFTVPRAPARGPRLHGVVPRQRLRRARARARSTRARATSCSSATRSSPAPGSAATPRATTSCGSIYGREVVTLRARRPELLPPRHRHRRARPDPRAGEHRLPAEGLRRGLARTTSQARFPDAIIVNDEDAAVLGLNSFSDGYNVVIASRADRLRASAARARLRRRRRRPLRAAARRRRREVLHPGAAAMTTRRPTAPADRAVSRAGRGVRRPQLPPAARSSSHPADGAWVTDVEGARYLDCLAAYSAVNFGHAQSRARRRRQATSSTGSR